MKHKPIIHLGDLDFGVIDSSYHSKRFGRYSFSLNQMSHVNTCEILYIIQIKCYQYQKRNTFHFMHSFSSGYLSQIN